MVDSIIFYYIILYATLYYIMIYHMCWDAHLHLLLRYPQYGDAHLHPLKRDGDAHLHLLKGDAIGDVMRNALGIHRSPQRFHRCP